MQSLEPEYQHLRSVGVIDEATATSLIDVERGTIFSLHLELRLVLYFAVVAIMAGIGLLLKAHLAQLGPWVITLFLLVASLLGYASAEYTRRRERERSIGGDYVLLLAGLLLSAAVGYAEVQFQWLGAAWSWHLLLLALWHGVTAYYFNSRLLLTIALTALAGWFGVSLQPDMIHLLWIDNLSLAKRQLTCAALLMIWRLAHRYLARPEPFTDLLTHAAANLSMWAALVYCSDDATVAGGILLLLTLAGITIRHGLQQHQEGFVAYSIVYTAIGLCMTVARWINDDILAVLMCLIIMTSAIVALWQCHQHLKATRS